MRTICALVFLLSSAHVGFGQIALHVGLSKQQVVAKMGPPTRYFDADTQLYLRNPLQSLAGPVFEIYMRKAPGNEFKLSIHYRDDESQSRLHPIRRVDRVIMDFDHPEPLERVLRTLPEIEVLCRSGCKMQLGDVGGATGTVLSDAAKREILSIIYYDQTGHEKDVTKPNDSVSRVEFETFFDAPSSFVDEGTWSPQTGGGVAASPPRRSTPQ